MTITPGHDLLEAIAAERRAIDQWYYGPTPCRLTQAVLTCNLVYPFRRRYFERAGGKEDRVSTYMVPAGYLACMLGRPVTGAEFRSAVEVLARQEGG